MTFHSKFPSQKFVPLFLPWVQPLSNGAEFTLFVAKNIALFQTVRTLRFASLKWRGRWFKNWIEWHVIEFLAPPSFFSSKKWIKLIPKTIGNRKKRLCVRLRSGLRDKHHLGENLQIKKHKSVRRSFCSPNCFVLFDLQIFSGGVYPPSATSCTISFFYFQ